MNATILLLYPKTKSHNLAVIFVYLCNVFYLATNTVLSLNAPNQIVAVIVLAIRSISVVETKEMLWIVIATINSVMLIDAKSMERMLV